MPLNQYFETKLALGSDVTFVVVCESAAAATRVLQNLWRQTFLFERRFSRFLPMSELSEFNRKAGQKTPVSPEFRELLLAARQLGEQTEGLFNPFVLPALQRAGYTRSFVAQYADDEQEDYSGRQVVRVTALEVGAEWAQIPYGTALDMGGCGKGYLADQLAASLPRDVVRGYWLSLGGDIAAGGHDEQGRPWTVRIQGEQGAGHDLSAVIQGSAAPFAVATSGTGVRRGRKRGRAWHHIIDPRTLTPAKTDVRLATVHANTTLQADVLASCAIILGSAEAPAWLRRQGVLGAVLQVEAGRSARTRVVQFGKSVNNVMNEAVHA
jgi:FAD:protein FMN transferase